MADKPIGFVINQQLLTFVLGAIALCGSVYAGVTWVNDRTYFEAMTKADIVQLEQNDADNTAATKELAGEVGRLADSMDEFALTLKEVEVIQRVAPLTGLNTTAVPNLTTNR